jgi:hypothetical protein
MTTEKGIIDYNNPFVLDSWIKQGYGFTPHRQKQISKLFGELISTIKGINPKNENSYAAFVGIRWGFAKIDDKKLAPTEKWQNRFQYNGHGNPIKNIRIKV